MAGLIAWSMLLVLLPLSCSEITLRLSEQSVNLHPAPRAPPLTSPHPGDLLRKDETTPLNAKQTCKSRVTPTKCVLAMRYECR